VSADVASEGEHGRVEHDAPDRDGQVERDAPDQPRNLPRGAWSGVLKGTIRSSTPII
jgi:hypothetical protein